ncbi:MAG: hypothetical protein EWM72_03265 [Nitrospira sp.]|nr:MAG: hypothetical protein EWM72_03265 [Nitrospira sp.]
MGVDRGPEEFLASLPSQLQFITTTTGLGIEPAAMNLEPAKKGTESRQ